MTKREGELFDALIDAYHERAHLLAFIARIYPATIGKTDPEDREWNVLTVVGTNGQMCWHIADGDMYLFQDVLRDESVKWDGHTTVEKYERLLSAFISPL